MKFQSDEVLGRVHKMHDLFAPDEKLKQQLAKKRQP
jgi:hypothetical protein